MMEAIGRELAVRKFQEYLRIKSVHPNPDYTSAILFLDGYAKELGLDVKHVEVGTERKVVVVMTLVGKDPSLLSILLNSHIDVVPAYPECWKYDPFSGYKDESGNIFGRGAQDMKSVGIQYLEAIRALRVQKNDGFDRTVHITFMPDEENNDGHMGMKLFLETPEFKALNVGLALDEGLANPANKYSVFYGERSPWCVRVTCKGNTGHGSRFISNTAAEKVRKVINSVAKFRADEEAKLNSDSCLFLGDVTSANLTVIRGGDCVCVVPGEIVATFDFRIPPTVDLDKFEKKIAEWCKNAGDDVIYEFLEKNMNQKVTDFGETNPWWVAFSSVLKNRGVEIVKEIFPAASDGRFLRELGYPVIGFSPMRNTPILLHDNDEFVNEVVFLEGIKVYTEIISTLANFKF